MECSVVAVVVTVVVAVVVVVVVVGVVVFVVVLVVVGAVVVAVVVAASLMIWIMVVLYYRYRQHYHCEIALATYRCDFLAIRSPHCVAESHVRTTPA